MTSIRDLVCRIIGGQAISNVAGERGDVWARPNMTVTFRAELMPGRTCSERKRRVACVLPNNRITVRGVAGEHVEAEFER